MANLGFDMNIDEAVKDYKGGFEIIPPGVYPVVIISSELKENNSKTGKVLKFKYELQDGSKRSINDNLNIVNPSEVAQKIGRSQLAKIAQVIGHKGALNNTDVLHGRSFNVKITIEEFESNTEKGKMLKSNKVVDYFEKGAASSNASPASTGSSKPAW